MARFIHVCDMTCSYVIYLWATVLPRFGSKNSEMTSMYVLIDYGVATISRLLKITGLFCRISSVS